MGFIEKFQKDTKHREIYGVGLMHSESAKLFILEYLMPKVADMQITSKLKSEFDKYNV